MKKRLFIFGCIFILSAALISALVAGTGSAGKVSICSAETLSGDAALADGLAVNLKGEIADVLYWDIDIYPGEKTACEGSAEYYDFSADTDSYYSETSSSNYMNMYFQTYYSIGLSPDPEDEVSAYGRYIPSLVLKAAAEKTNAGESYTLSGDLSDYYEYFPVIAALYFYDTNLSTEDAAFVYSYAYESFSSALSEFFKIPVPSGLEFTLTTERDTDGTLVYAEYDFDDSKYSDLSLPVMAPEAAVDGGFLFTFMDTDSSWFEETDGGFGIYYMGYETDELNQTVSLSSIKTVFSLDAGINPYCLCAEEDKNVLYMIAEEDGFLTLTVIDMESWEQTDKQVLAAAAAGDYAYVYDQDQPGNGILIQTAKGFIVISDEGDGLFIPLSDSEYEEYFSSYSSNVSILCRDFDVVFVLQNEYDTGCGFTLLICNDEGIEYAGRYSTEIDSYPAANEAKEFRVTSLSISEN